MEPTGLLPQIEIEGEGATWMEAVKAHLVARWGEILWAPRVVDPT